MIKVVFEENYPLYDRMYLALTNPFFVKELAGKGVSVELNDNEISLRVVDYLKGKETFNKLLNEYLGEKKETK